MGRANVDAMLRGLTARQFLNWIYYEQLEPFEEQRADWRNAHIVGTLYNIYRDRKRSPEPYPIKEFRIKFDPEPPRPKQDAKTHRTILRAIAASFADLSKPLG